MSEHYVQCMLCNRMFSTIHWSHLKNEHNMDLKTYKQMFPNAKTVNDETKKQMSIRSSINNTSRKGVPRTQEVKDKMKKTKANNPKQAWNKGIAVSEEHKQHLSKLKKQLYETGKITHWNLGNTTSDETKQKISKTLKDQNRHMTSEQLIKRADTIAIKKEQGWIPPGTRRKGTTVTDERVLQKVRAISKQNRDRKTTQALQQIYHLCEENKLTINSIINNYWIDLTCNICATNFSNTRQVFKPSTKHGKNLCPKCYPSLISSGKSEKELQLYDFVKQNYPSAILGSKKHLDGKELDILIPELNIAIEFNGLYWHSENGGGSLKDKHHLHLKTMLAKDSGIRLVHIFEDEWDNKCELVKSRLLHILNKQQTLCYARQCDVRIIDKNTKDTFLSDNHIMNTDISTVYLGAYYQNALVAVMTFKPTSYIKGGDGATVELSRFAVVKFNHIPGIASKMFKYYTSHFDVKTIISYCDLRWNQGQSYVNMGFELAARTPPSYWYLVDNYKTRVHRSVFMKHKLIIQHPELSDMTEWQIMQHLKCDRIWDCGTLKFIWNRLK